MLTMGKGLWPNLVRQKHRPTPGERIAKEWKRGDRAIQEVAFLLGWPHFRRASSEFFDYSTKVEQAQNDLPFCSREEGHGRKLATRITSLFGAAV